MPYILSLKPTTQNYSQLIEIILYEVDGEPGKRTPLGDIPK